MKALPITNGSLTSPEPPPKSHRLHSLPSNSLFTHHHNTTTFKTKTYFSTTKKKTPPSSKTKQPKKFTEQNAFPNSLPPHTKNPHAIYEDIQRFANQNKLKEALTILDYLEQKGIPVNPTTFSSLIASCVRTKALNEAKVIHTHIRINGLEKNEYLQTKLVHMYASCGSINDAKKVFDEMRVTSVYPWNALLRGNVILGGRNYKEVSSTFSEMRSLNVDLNVYSYSCLIKSLAGAKAFYQGLKTHALLVKNGLINDKILMTCLIDMYFKCGKIKLACQVFEEITERDVVLYGVMISGFAHNKMEKTALKYVKLMVNEGIEVNSVILTIILPVIGELSEKIIGKEIHAYVIKTKEYIKQLFIQSALIDMYCKCEDMIYGRKVFYESKERNVISWTALLSGYITNKRYDQALKSIIWMQQENCKPDLVTLATILPVCGKLKALNQGKELHSYAIKQGYFRHLSVSTSLMMMYSKCGVVLYSSRVFNNMEKMNVIAWTAMIDSYIESGSLDSLYKALEIFRKMQFSKYRPDSVTISRVLMICGEVKDLKLGLEIHGQVLKKNLENIPFVLSEIVKMYGKCGEIEKAEKVFDGVKAKGSMTWTSMIEAYGYNGNYEEGIRVFRKMVSDGFKPNHFTFISVLRICEEGGFGDEACEFFTLMTRRYKIKACEEHYMSVINVLMRLGEVEKAEKFVRLRLSMIT